MEKNRKDQKRLDKVTNDALLRRVNEDRQILNYLARTHRWIGHVFTEGRMKGKATRGS